MCVSVLALISRSAICCILSSQRARKQRGHDSQGTQTFFSHAKGHAQLVQPHKDAKPKAVQLVTDTALIMTPKGKPADI